MKTIKTIVLILQCSLLGSTIHAQSNLTNITPVTPEGEYSTPIWSPNGEKILFTDHHNNALFVLSMKTDKKITKIKSAEGIGYMANWSADGKSVVFREKKEGNTFSDLQVKSIQLDSKKESTLKGVHPDNIKGFSYAKSNTKNLIIYINQETLKLEAKEGINEKPWVITKEEGQYYHPIVSPDQKMVVVHEGPTMFLYPIYKNEKRKELGNGLASGWFPDNSGIITFEDKSEDGHNVTSSELFFISAKSSAKTQLTTSDDLIEMWGNVSPNGKKIAFSDEKSGKIFVADLHLKK